MQSAAEQATKRTVHETKLALALRTAAQMLDMELLWRCDDCGYQRPGGRRPVACAGCGADGGRFTGLSAVEWRRRLAAQVQGGMP
jgi:rubrerythrin